MSGLFGKIEGQNAFSHCPSCRVKFDRQRKSTSFDWAVLCRDCNIEFTKDEVGLSKMEWKMFFSVGWAGEGKQYSEKEFERFLRLRAFE